MGALLALAIQKSVIQNPDLKMGEAYAYNPPGLKGAVTDGMDNAEVAVLSSKAHVYSVVGDPVSEYASNHIGMVEKIYSSVEGGFLGFGKHGMLALVTENATSFDTTYINSDNSINVENVSNAYNDIVAKEKSIMAEMANSDTNSWFDYIRSAIPDSVEGLLGATNYSAQLAEIALQKAGLAEILKGSVTSFEGEIEFWSQEFSEYNTELAEVLHLNRCLEPTMLFDAMAEQTESSILEFIGGATNKKILDTIVDSIKLQDTPEAQEQFLDSLENGGLLDSLLGSDVTDSLGIKSVDKLVLEKFQQASTQRYGDRLVVDLDGDGIETIVADGSVLFDHDADGQATGTGWAAADDGLLVRDVDG